MPESTAAEKIHQLLEQLRADRRQRDEIRRPGDPGMICTECYEYAELICVDCEDAFCPEHLHSLGAHWANVVCSECMDREMAAAS